MSSRIRDGRNIPLKWRFLAWWNGYDIQDFIQIMSPAQESPRPQPQKKIEKKDPLDWDMARVGVAQRIWGDGFCGPGGAQNVIDMSKLLALSPQMSAMVIGAELGGPTRVLAQEFGVWITGFEDDRMLAEEGMKRSVDAGLGRKAEIAHKDLNKATEFGRRFDRAFSKETIFTIKNKATLFTSIHDHLKDDSLFLMTDFVLKNDDSTKHSTIADWITHEPRAPYPASSPKMVDYMTKSGFTVRTHEDITPHFIKMIGEAWAHADQHVMLMAEDAETRQKNMTAFMEEADLWGRRTQALRSGELRVCRYLAHKPASFRETASAT